MISFFSLYIISKTKINMIPTEEEIKFGKEIESRLKNLSKNAKDVMRKFLTKRNALEVEIILKLYWIAADNNDLELGKKMVEKLRLHYLKQMEDFYEYKDELNDMEYLCISNIFRDLYNDVLTSNLFLI